MENKDLDSVQISEPKKLEVREITEFDILPARPKAVTAVNKLIIEASKSIMAPKRKLSNVEQAKEKELELILNDDDFVFYREKKEEYLESYPDLVDPFDLDDLHLMIMEQIMQRNLLKRKKKNPAFDIMDDYEHSVKRQLELKRSLSVRRTDRVKNKETKKTTINIAELSVAFNDKERMQEFQNRVKMMQEEEEELNIGSTGVQRKVFE